MDKEPETTDEAKPIEPAKKLMMDKANDFRFHAAYLIYSDAWDKASSEEVKNKLNEMLTALSTEKVDYETFYREISQFRVEYNPEHFRGSGGGRTYIETGRKREWRRREEKESRNKRHGR